MTPHLREIKDLHAKGLSDREIWEAIGRRIKIGTVNKYRRELGLAPNKGKPLAYGRRKIDREYLAREFDERMKALQTHGDYLGVRRQIRAVADEIGASEKRVTYIYMYELKLVIPMPVVRYSKEQYAEAKRLIVEHGLSYAEAGRLTGVDRKRLGDVFPGHGMSPSESRMVGWVNAELKKMGA